MSKAKTEEIELAKEDTVESPLVDKLVREAKELAAKMAL
jgi:hypothetical protein